jgi:hypothetical protein
MARIAVVPAHVSATATGAVVTKTATLSNICIVIDYTRVSGSGAGTMTFYGALDSSGTTKYKLGVHPMLTGTVDADGAITYGESTCVGYYIDGCHQYIDLSWNEDTDPASVSSYIIGVEE